MQPNDLSLCRVYPRHWHVPVLIVLALGLLVCGVVLPTLKLTKVIFFTDTYSIWRSVWELWHTEHYVLAAVVLFFSVIFPFGKLGGLLAAWFVPMDGRLRGRTLGWLEALGRWSMLDVFVVAVLIVLVKAEDVADATAAAGLYFFAVAIALSMVTTAMVYRLAKRAPEAAEPEPTAAERGP